MKGWVSVALVAVAACADPVGLGVGVATQDEGGVDDFVSVSAGLSHTCALTTDGTAWCWGSNEFGQLGVPPDGTTCARRDREIPCAVRPRLVATAVKFREISAGGDHSCALSLDDRVYCWGDNLYGQLGDPSRRDSFTPIPVVTTSLFTDIAAGGEHSCALRTDGVLLCWGSNAIGQLGSGSTGTGATIPATVQTSARFATVTAGVARTCARTADGTVYCWGATWVERTSAGQEVVRSQSRPVLITGLAPVQAVVAGMFSTCVIDRDGAPFCWEANPAGSIGDGTTRGSTSPKPVSTGLAFVSISTGRSHTCGIAAGGGAWCWGDASTGQLGVPPAITESRCGTARVPCRRAPIRVSGWRVFAQISAGLGDHTCGVTLGGNVYCWGAGSLGQRGDGRTSSEWSPVRAVRPAIVTSMAVPVSSPY